MTFSLMRRLDNWAGTPLCLLLGALEWVRRRWAPARPVPGDAEVGRIVVLKFLGMGSLVEAAPMIRALRRRFPKASVALVTFEDCAEAAALLGLFDEVRVVRTRSPALFACDTVAAIGWARRRRFDAAYDLEFYSKYSYAVSYLTGAPMRVGYYVRALRYVRLLTHPVPYNGNRHVSEAFLAQVDPAFAGGDAAPGPAGAVVSPPRGADVPCEPRISEAARRRVDDWLAAAGPFSAAAVPGAIGAPGTAGGGAAGVPNGEARGTTRRRIAVNVNASGLSRLRLWPPEHFAELTRRLAERLDPEFIFIGRLEDAPRVAEVLRLLPSAARASNWAGRTTVEELLALLARVDLLITNDSGPLHLAAWVATPTVAFFGAESARVYGPRGARHVNLDKELYCSPCLNVYNFKEFDCPYAVRCLREIGPDEAFAAACRLLGA